MIKTIEYAILSNHIYSPSSALFGRIIADATLIAENAHNVAYNGWYYIADVDQRMVPTNNFYAVLYVKFKSGTAIDAVVAIRGTDPKKINNDEVDIISWWSDVLGHGQYDMLPSYYPKASHFFKAARDYAHHYFPSAHISLTGHSLGAALAQLLVAAGKPFTAVTFNSPGIGHMPGVHKNMADYVTGINSKYGFFNKVGESFGKVIYVDVPNEETQAKTAWAHLHDREKDEKALQDSYDPIKIDLLDLKIKHDDAIFADDFYQSYAAQHSISNMITAIRHDPTVANQVFV